MVCNCIHVNDLFIKSMQKNTLHERLRQERERLELNQTAFAEIGGVQKLSQVNYEKGARKPDSSYFERIAQAGADVSYIITGVHSHPVSQSGWGESKESHPYVLQEPQASYGPEAGEQLAEDEKTLLENYRIASKEGKDMLLASSKAIADAARKLDIEDPNTSQRRDAQPIQTGIRRKAQGSSL